MTTQPIFSAGASTYDRARRQLIPCFDEFYGTAVEQAGFPQDAPLRVLDLGAGTGLLSSFFAEAYPRATFLLTDVSSEMLVRARDRFVGDVRFAFAELDHGSAALPARFDLIVSALSIHHVSHEQKQALFGRIYEALHPGGVFVNADQVLGETEARDQRQRDAWLAATRRLGVSDEDLAAATDRMAHDITATLADQLSWLSEAGFVEVGCAYRWYGFAVYSGRKIPV